MKIVKFICLMLIPAGLVYFYYGYSLPVEFSVLPVKEAWILCLIFSAWLLLFLEALQAKDDIRNIRSALKLSALFLLVLHHSIVGGFTLLTDDYYKDQEVYFVDPLDENHKKIQQWPVGFGSDLRFIECYELGPFLRYIQSYDADRP